MEQSEIRFNVLKEFYVQKLKGGNVSINIEEWTKRWEVSRREIEVALIYLVERGLLSGTFVGGTDVPIVMDITSSGMEDYESQTEHYTSNPDPKTVFVVHGRNEQLRMDLFAFLRAIGLNPMEFSQAIKLTGQASPYIGQILDAAFKNAQAVIVLLSPDDEARLRQNFLTQQDSTDEIELTPQPRQNVLFEAGLSFGYKPERTILVKVGKLRAFSDVYGRHEVRLTNDAAMRQELANRLRNAGCAVNTQGTDWLSIGNFDAEEARRKTETAPPKRLNISEAESIALDHVKKERPEATGISVDTRNLEKDQWHISGHYPEASGSIYFDIVVDALSGTIVSSDFQGRFMVSVG
ncbi:MAG: TIR domain-containing protein [Candidatus Bathyarchaeia archaeon]